MDTAKLKKLGEHMIAIADGNIEAIAHSEADVVEKETTEAPVTGTDESKKIDEIHDYLFNDDDVPLAEVEPEPTKVEEPKAETVTPEESKDETVDETPAWFKTYKEDQEKQLKEKDEQIEKLNKELNGDDNKIVDPLVHNPEGEAKPKYPMRKDPKLAPDDPTSAFVHHFGE